jgi:outer membrane protein assembly factor BamD (BamD/ComL family)
MRNVIAMFAAIALLCVNAHAEEATAIAGALAKVKDAKDRQSCLEAVEDGLAKCAAYDDYEKLCKAFSDLAAKQPGYCHDVFKYAVAKTRVAQLAHLAKKNDIESGRVYMSVNEKYYNEALSSLDEADAVTASKDLSLEAAFLRFVVFRELFQNEKADAAFNGIVERIASYSDDKAATLAKLNETAKKFCDNGMAEYAVKLKFLFASKTDAETARMLAQDIRASAENLLEQGNAKEAQATFDTYLELAKFYYDEETAASRLLEIAEKYFDKKRYKDAVRYYSEYVTKYAAGKMADYATYKLALSYYNDKNSADAVYTLENFLKAYQNSVWFDKAFESLSRVYYETSDTENAITRLGKMAEDYASRETVDYARLLIAVLYYSKSDYDRSLDTLNGILKEFPRSAYLVAAQSLIADIGEIKKGTAPSYSFGSKDIFRRWEPYTPIGGGVSVSGAEVMKDKNAKPNETYVSAKPGSTITFTLPDTVDLDRFNEYWQDKEDQSRLPREVRTGTEKDLVFMTWAGPESGKFLDDKQSSSRKWQAPNEPGEYTISAGLGDLALVRPPDTGTRKDNPLVLTIHVIVEK